MKMSVKSRVKRGAELLDRKIPGWEKRINLDILNINSCMNCILGQIYHMYVPSFLGLGMIEAHMHGFAVLGDTHAELNEDKHLLNKEWTKVIQLRLAEQQELSDLCAAVEEEAAQPVSR